MVGFGWHKVISRELNQLRATLQLVKMVLLCSAEIFAMPTALCLLAFLHVEAAQSSLGKQTLLSPAVDSSRGDVFHTAEWCALGYHMWFRRQIFEIRKIGDGRIGRLQRQVVFWTNKYWRRLWESAGPNSKGGACRDLSRSELAFNLAATFCCLWFHIYRACQPHKMLSERSSTHVPYNYGLAVTSWMNGVTP